MGFCFWAGAEAPGTGPAKTLADSLPQPRSFPRKTPANAPPRKISH